MKTIKLPDDVHARLKAYAKERQYGSFATAISVLLDVRDDANKTFQAALSLIESRSASTATKPVTPASTHASIFTAASRGFQAYFPCSFFVPSSSAGPGVIAAQATSKPEVK